MTYLEWMCSKRLPEGVGIVIAAHYLYYGKCRATRGVLKPVFRYLHEASE